MTGLSVGTVNKTLLQLNKSGLIENYSVSTAGLAALEPYRVKRAVFIAAGFGSRLVPITLNTPKPLVRVKGVRIIDTLLDAVCTAEIEEIIIVRGYFSEQFDQLKYKYPNIQFLENPLYNESNNISSAMCVRFLLQNAYVLESDLVLNNPGLISKYQYASNYLGVPVERTDDWCFETRNGIITRVRVGGRNCHHMFGISYWSQTDGAKLADHIKQVYEMPGGKERYWDQVSLEYFIKDYSVEVRECSFDDIIEIDTFNELKKIDKTYDT
jgi:CTP:phosphocholine cytidylyltransferase-like protein